MASLASRVRPYVRRPHAAGQSYYPDEVAALYAFPKVAEGKPVVIAIGELGGGYHLEEINTQLTRRGLPAPIITDLSVRGAKNSPGDPSGADGEVVLDIVCAAAAYSYCTGKPARILVVFAPNDGTGMSDAVAAALNSPLKPAVFSWSWGAPEDAWDKPGIVAMENNLKEAAHVGMTVLAAAGDNGSGDGEQGMHADFPASSAYVLGCGGTSLQSSHGTVISENVWNDGMAGGSTGGGLSSLFPTPDYQKAVFPSGQKGRGVPDWAGNADPQTGYRLTVDGQDGVIGGTSAVAPLFSGLIAALVATTGKPFGGPEALYAINAQSIHAFRDVTQGNNGSFPAGPGYDCDTGLGVPVGTAILAVLQGGIIAPPPPAGDLQTAVLAATAAAFTSMPVPQLCVQSTLRLKVAVTTAIKKAFASQPQEDSVFDLKTIIDQLFAFIETKPPFAGHPFIIQILEWVKKGIEANLPAFQASLPKNTNIKVS